MGRVPLKQEHVPVNMFRPSLKLIDHHQIFLQYNCCGRTWCLASWFSCSMLSLYCFVECYNRVFWDLRDTFGKPKTAATRYYKASTGSHIEYLYTICYVKCYQFLFSNTSLKKFKYSCFKLRWAKSTSINVEINVKLRLAVKIQNMFVIVVYCNVITFCCLFNDLLCWSNVCSMSAFYTCIRCNP